MVDSYKEVIGYMNIIELVVCQAKAVAGRTAYNPHKFKPMGYLISGNYISQCKTPCTSISTHIYSEYSAQNSWNWNYNNQNWNNNNKNNNNSVLFARY